MTISPHRSAHKKRQRPRSKIFFASDLLISHDDSKQAVDFDAGKAKNI
jgi:hypothetical protein